MPLVSIIVPTYNTPSCLMGRCLESLCGQTYKKLEIIVVDDGSDSSHAEALSRFAGSDDRICLLEGGHRGVSHARNVGIGVANGDWVAFVDADDTVTASFVEEAVTLALQESLDMVCGSVCYLFAGGVVEGGSQHGGYCVVDDRESLVLAADQMLAPFAVAEFSGPNFRGRGPVAKLFRRSIMGDLRFEEGVSLGEDALFNYRFIRRCGSIAIVDRVWYRYLQNAESAVHSSDIAARKSSIDGILAARRQEENVTPFLARCSLVASDGIEGLARGERIHDARKNAASLLRYASERGCFSRLAAEGLEITPATAVFWRACRAGHFMFAYFYWNLKLWVRNLVNGRRLAGSSDE